MTPEEWQFLTQQGNHVPNPVQPLTEEQASVAKIPPGQRHAAGCLNRRLPKTNNAL